MHAPYLRAQDLLRVDWTDATRLVAYRAAAAVAAVYTAGLVAGEALHQLNQQLAATYRCLVVGGERAAGAVAEIDAATDAFVEAAIAGAASTLDGLSVVELRRLVRSTFGSGLLLGGRAVAQARRADLLEVLAQVGIH